MSFTINGSKFLVTTRSDASFHHYNQQRFSDIILVIKGDEIPNLDMREEFFDVPPQNFPISNRNGVLPQTWSGFSTRMPNHQFPENLLQDSGNGLRYIENVPDLRPGPSRQNWMQDMAQVDSQIGTRHPLPNPENNQTAIQNRDFHLSSERVAAPGNEIHTQARGEDGGFSTVAEGRLEGDDERERNVDDPLDSQRELSSEHSGSITSVANRSIASLVSSDDLSIYRGSNRNIAEPDVPTPQGSTLSLPIVHANEQHQNTISLSESMRSLSVSQPSRSLSTLSESVERNYQWRKLCHKVILAKNSPLLDEFLENATKILEVINPTEQSFEEALFTAAMTQVEGRKIMQVEVKDVDASSMESILTFIYTGELICEFEDFATLLQDAEKLKFIRVQDVCQDLVNQPLDASNCISVLLLNYYSGNEEAISVGLDFVISHITEVVGVQNEEDIRHLPLDIMEKIMNSDEIVEANAEDAFEMLFLWAETGQENKTDTLHDLMKPKIGLLSFDFVLDNLTDPDVIQLDYASSKLVHSTMVAKKPVSSSPHPKTSLVNSAPFSSVEGDDSNEETLVVVTETMASNIGRTGVHEKFDTENNAWIEWTTKDLGQAFEVVMVGTFMAIIGEIKDGQHQSIVKLYNTETQELVPGPNMIKPRAFFGCCVVNGDTVIVCGGRTTKNEHFGECEQLKLNPDRIGRWKRLPPMKTKRFWCSAASIDSKVFNIGGQSGFNTTATVHSTVEEFDVTSKKWRSRSNMNEGRSDFAIATHQKMIYVFGGWREMTILNSCERYDPSIDKWQYICCLPSPRQGCAAGLLKNEIFIIGGIDSKYQSLKTTEVYDPREDKFQKGPDLNNEVRHPSSVAVKKLLVFN